MTGTFGAVVLAAGGSSRLGRPKQLLKRKGKTLLRRTVEAALQAGGAPVVVVIGAHSEEMQAELAGLQVLVARNEKWSEGLSSSLRLGIEALQPTEAQAALLLPCDQPLLSCELLLQWMQRFVEGALIVACEYGGTWGAPLLFERALWPALQVLEGDCGAQRVARDNARLVQSVPFEGGALDIDSDDDYQKLLSCS